MIRKEFYKAFPAATESDYAAMLAHANRFIGRPVFSNSFIDQGITEIKFINKYTDIEAATGKGE